MYQKILGPLLWGFVACAWAQEPKLLINESFDAAPALPKDWNFQTWQPNISSADIHVDAGNNSLHLKSSQANHAYLSKAIPVLANHHYLLEAKVKARGANPNALAAVIGIEGNADASETVLSDEQWQMRQVYLDTGDATSVTVLLGLGHFANNNQGEAWFDDVSMTMVDIIPTGSKVLKLSPSVPVAAPPISAPSASPWLKLALGLLLLIVLSVALAWRLKRADADAINPQA
ncbi:hypothetical protein K4H28_10820 [Deefgea tanakiae]|jgi:hypothetical protein|uniref:Uncharacterized protein n=1 Tax=Deefgea tanakiae TaxID=2865840 RepID=A0ABX8Z2L6_9NEIS|nr:hypothetical protein [Deefgea tanakiae]QZA76807.1 hypothetical protein K4H28_10820 [Deefgea tanakiae]